MGDVCLRQDASGLALETAQRTAAVKKFRPLKMLNTQISNPGPAPIANGTYELVPESKSEQREAQVNLTKAAQDPNQSSEETKARYAQKGKPGA